MVKTMLQLFIVDNAISWISLYLMHDAIGFFNTYPLNSDFSGGWRNPLFEQPRPSFDVIMGVHSLFPHPLFSL